MKLIQKHKNINRQIAGLITAVIIVTVTFSCIVNSCFLGDFYVLKTKQDMVSLFKEMEKDMSQGLFDLDEAGSSYSMISEANCIDIMMSKSDGSIVMSFGADESVLLSNMRDSLFNQETSELLQKNADNYCVRKTSFNDPNSEYLILIGYLPNGDILFLRSSLNAINHASKAANGFLIKIFIVAIVISGIASFLLVKALTRPLFELIKITKQISNFDFTAKYKPQKIYNELDNLGEHVNEMSTTLERAINQLTRANESLKRDLELQEETENMRKEFISNVSHELKTPIALIQGYAEGLQEGIMDDENSRQIYLDVILDEANKMNRLVREMLILNQLEAGQMEADFDDFDLTGILDGIIDSNKIYFEAQNVDFSFINKEKVMVKADEFLVEQVFTNFLSNAIHYVMNENIITVKYEFTKKGKVRISVFNSGNNIPKKDIKHIWEKFYKVDKARSREYGGSGIGLSVVKAVMELIHEKYGVENLANGVEFWFELSLSKDTKIKQNS